MEGKRRPPELNESKEFSNVSGNVLPPDFGADKENSVGKNKKKINNGFEKITGKNWEKVHNDYFGERKLKDPDFVKAGNNESEILKRISSITEKDKQLVEYRKNIDDIINCFESSEKSKKDFNLMMEKFDSISWHREVKSAWNQEQVDRVLEIYEKNVDNLDFSICQGFFIEVLGNGEANDLVANFFIRRIQREEKIPLRFLEKINSWASDNLHVMDSSTTSDFLLSLLNNSDKIDKDFIKDIFGYFETEAVENFIKQYSQELYKNEKNIYKILKDIEVLNYVKNMADDQYFEEYTVKYNLNIFKKNNDNYFIDSKIDQVLESFYKTHAIDEKRFYIEAIKKEYADFISKIPDMSKMKNSEVEEYFNQFDYNFFSLYDINQPDELEYSSARSISEKRFYIEAIKKEYADFILNLPDTFKISDKDVEGLFDKLEYRIEKYISESNNKRRKNIYDDENIRNLSNIEPAILKYKEYNEDKKEKKKEEFCFTKISEKYGIIYTPEGGVDSFFELNKEGNDKENNLNINDVLAKEGFKAENMSEEEYKKMVLTYKALIELPMREKIENEFGIELKNFNIREQVQFVNFLSSKTIKEVEEVKEFLNQGKSDEAKNNRIKSFLSLELGGEEMGEKILKIGNSLDAESADGVFAKYAEIINLTDKTREDLEEIFKDKKNISEKEREKIVQNILSKAKQVLVDFSGESDRVGKKDTKDIMESLGDCKVNLILTASIYKGIDRSSEVKFEDLEGVEFEKKTANELSDEEISQMKKIYAENYKFNPVFQKVIVENFENILKEMKDKTTLYIFKENDEVVAFNRFDDMGGGRKYFGSFNVKRIMNSSKIGDALMEESLKKEAEDNEIEAGTIPDTLISARYIGGKCGFVVKKLETDYKNTGVSVFDIEKREENKKYRYFNYSDKQIINEFEKENSGNDFKENASNFILKLNPKSSEFIKIADDLVNRKGYVISNYVFGKGAEETYCAFEKA